MILAGTYYPPDSSRAVVVSLTLEDNRTLTLNGEGMSRVESLHECLLSEPLGRMVRHFMLPDGARVEVEDLEALASWEHEYGRRTGLHLVHLLESRWRWVASAAVFLLLFMMVGYIWGLPLVARHLAFKLPPKVGQAASEQTVALFTKLLSFKESEVPEKRRALITAEFQRMAAAMHPKSPWNYRLKFFKASLPNAFALPDGLVCITDELVEKAKDDKEIYGVLAHEIMHVREQHGMRSVLQNSAVFLIWTLMTGDVSTLAGMGSALPAALAQAGYSRGFEQEADIGAADYMIRRSWGVKPLCDILDRIDPEHMHLGGAEEAISSHPLTKKRIAFLQGREAAAKASTGAP